MLPLPVYIKQSKRFKGKCLNDEPYAAEDYECKLACIVLEHSFGARCREKKCYCICKLQ